MLGSDVFFFVRLFIFIFRKNVTESRAFFPKTTVPWLGSDVIVNSTHFKICGRTLVFSPVPTFRRPGIWECPEKTQPSCLEKRRSRPSSSWPSTSHSGPCTDPWTSAPQNQEPLGKDRPTWRMQKIFFVNIVTIKRCVIGTSQGSISEHNQISDVRWRLDGYLGHSKSEQLKMGVSQKNKEKKLW